MRRRSLHAPPRPLQALVVATMHVLLLLPPPLLLLRMVLLRVVLRVLLRVVLRVVLLDRSTVVTRKRTVARVHWVI